MKKSFLIGYSSLRKQMKVYYKNYEGKMAFYLILKITSEFIREH